MLIASIAGACGFPFAPPLPEIVPVTTPIANEPEAQSYVVEFAEVVPGPDFRQVLDWPEPAIPVDHALIRGKVLEVDHNDACSLWAILSYEGSRWWEQQFTYVYFEKTGELREITAAASKGSLLDAFVLAGKDCERPFLLGSFSDMHDYSPATDELWTYDLRDGEWTLISNGSGLGLSPDRSKATFWRSDDFAFHCLYVWSIQSGAIRPIVSLNEADPGSGTSWDTRWSRDSKAISIRGDCTGFQDARGAYQEFDFIYLVSSEKIVSCK